MEYIYTVLKGISVRDLMLCVFVETPNMTGLDYIVMRVFYRIIV